MSIITPGASAVLGSAFASASFQGDGVQDTAALTALLPEQRFDKQERTVEGPPLEQYIFDAQSSAASNPPDILVPDDSPASGRWFRHKPSGGVPGLHDLGGAEHGADTFANLDAKVSDGGLVITVEPGTDNIQAAHDALPAGGGIIRLKAGTFAVTTPVAVTKPNVQIVGFGAATILDITGGAGAISASGTRFRLLDMKIDLNAAAGGILAVDITAGASSLIERLIFENVQGANTGYVKWASSEAHILKCTGIVTAGSVTIGFSATATAVKALVSGCHAPGTVTGFKSLADDGIIENCFALLVTTAGIRVEGDRQLVSDSSVSKADAVGSGIAVFGDFNIVSGCNIDLFFLQVEVQGDNCVVKGCNAASGAGVGVETFGTNCTISGCRLTSSTGIRPQATAAGCVIDGCTLIMPQTATLSRGIDVRAGNPNTIIGNTFIDGTGNTNAGSAGIVDGGVRTQCSGCRVLNTPARGIQSGADHAVIAGNSVEGAGSDGIRVTGDHATVSGNTVTGATLDGILLTGANQCAVVGNVCEGNTGFGINEAGASDLNLIVGNNVRGNTAGGISTVGAGTIVQEIENAVATTDATVTTIATIPIPDNTTGILEVRVLARRTDDVGRATYIRRAAVFREAAGSATIEGAVDSPLTRESAGNAPWNVTIAVSGNNALVQVAGQAGKTINWKSFHEIRRVR